MCLRPTVLHLVVVVGGRQCIVFFFFFFLENKAEVLMAGPEQMMFTKRDTTAFAFSIHSARSRTFDSNQ